MAIYFLVTLILSGCLFFGGMEYYDDGGGNRRHSDRGLFFAFLAMCYLFIGGIYIGVSDATIDGWSTTRYVYASFGVFLILLSILSYLGFPFAKARDSFVKLVQMLGRVG